MSTASANPTKIDNGLFTGVITKQPITPIVFFLNLENKSSDGGQVLKMELVSPPVNSRPVSTGRVTDPLKANDLHNTILNMVVGVKKDYNPNCSDSINGCNIFTMEARPAVSFDFDIRFIELYRFSLVVTMKQYLTSLQASTISEDAYRAGCDDIKKRYDELKEGGLFSPTPEKTFPDIFSKFCGHFQNFQS